MYYPLLRGRQNELLAIKELVEHSVLSPRVIPIIEPVKLSATLVNTIETFIKANHQLVLVYNPSVGSFFTDAKNQKNARYLERLKALINSTDLIHRGIIVNKNTPHKISAYAEQGVSLDSVIALCLEPDAIKYYNEAFGNRAIKTVVPFAPAFRRLKAEKILIDDKFNKKERNIEYVDPDDEFFSDDHLYTEGYVGFSDYSIIGKEYSESGFAPYAVAIHIIYSDSDNSLRIHHFVSDSNDDISDPAGKFYEALQKFHAWNISEKLDTLGVRQFEEIYQKQTYPGLGVVKKLSVMNHLELVSRFLDKEYV